MFCDIRKCFDSFPYDGLMSKRHKYGVHNIEHDESISYLTDGKRVTMFNRSCSSTQSIDSAIERFSKIKLITLDTVDKTIAMLVERKHKLASAEEKPKRYISKCETEVKSTLKYLGVLLTNILVGTTMCLIPASY